MELTSNIKRTFYKICIAILGCCIVLWFSVFSYALLYYLYIPAVAHVKPVHLKYDVSCSAKEKCFFPYDNITLVEHDKFQLLTSGQAYAIELILDMPETHRNIEQGMFMVRLDIQSQDGMLLKSSHRPAILRHRSQLFKVIYTLFFSPALLAGTTEEKQSFSIPLFEKYEESLHHPSHFAFVEIQARFAEIYSCSLRIHAQFTGLRYMMFYWSIFSAIVGIGSNFTLIAVIILSIWVRQIMYAERYVQLPDDDKVLIQEIRQSMQKSRTKEKDVPEQGTGIRRKSPVKSSIDEEIENISSYKDAPKLGTGIRRMDPVKSSISEEIEIISPYRGGLRKTSSVSEDSFSISDEEYALVEGEPADVASKEKEETEDNRSSSSSQTSESPSPSSIRKRYTASASS